MLPLPKSVTQYNIQESIDSSGELKLTSITQAPLDMQGRVYNYDNIVQVMQDTQCYICRSKLRGGQEYIKQALLIDRHSIYQVSFKSKR